LTETVITGVPQTVSFLRGIVADEAFRCGAYDTGFIATHADRLLHAARADNALESVMEPGT